MRCGEAEEANRPRGANEQRTPGKLSWRRGCGENLCCIGNEECPGQLLRPSIFATLSIFVAICYSSSGKRTMRWELVVLGCWVVMGTALAIVPKLDGMDGRLNIKMYATRKWTLSRSHPRQLFTVYWPCRAVASTPFLPLPPHPFPTSQFPLFSSSQGHQPDVASAASGTCRRRRLHCCHRRCCFISIWLCPHLQHQLHLCLLLLFHLLFPHRRQRMLLFTPSLGFLRPMVSQSVWWRAFIIRW